MEYLLPVFFEIFDEKFCKNILKVKQFFFCLRTFVLRFILKLEN